MGAAQSASGPACLLPSGGRRQTAGGGRPVAGATVVTHASSSHAVPGPPAGGCSSTASSCRAQPPSPQPQHGGTRLLTLTYGGYATATAVVPCGRRAFAIDPRPQQREMARQLGLTGSSSSCGHGSSSSNASSCGELPKAKGRGAPGAGKEGAAHTNTADFCSGSNQLVVVTAVLAEPYGPLVPFYLLPSLDGRYGRTYPAVAGPAPPWHLHSQGPDPAFAAAATAAAAAAAEAGAAAAACGGASAADAAHTGATDGYMQQNEARQQQQQQQQQQALGIERPPYGQRSSSLLGKLLSRLAGHSSAPSGSEKAGGGGGGGRNGSSSNRGSGTQNGNNSSSRSGPAQPKPAVTPLPVTPAPPIEPVPWEALAEARRRLTGLRAPCRRPPPPPPPHQLESGPTPAGGTGGGTAAAVALLAQMREHGYALVSFPAGPLPLDIPVLAAQPPPPAAAAAAVAPMAAVAPAATAATAPPSRAMVRLEVDTAAVVAAATEQALAFFGGDGDGAHGGTPAALRRRCYSRRGGDGHKFVGYSRQGARQWFQLRRYGGRVPYPAYDAWAAEGAEGGTGGAADAAGAGGGEGRKEEKAPGDRSEASAAGGGGGGGTCSSRGGGGGGGGVGDTEHASAGGAAAADGGAAAAVAGFQPPPGASTAAFEESFVQLFEICRTAAVTTLAGLAAGLAAEAVAAGAAAAAEVEAEAAAASFFEWIETELLDPADHLPWQPVASPRLRPPHGDVSPLNSTRQANTELSGAENAAAASGGNGGAAGAGGCGAAGADSAPETGGAFGSDVFRVYQYWRPPGAALPGLLDPATGLHADMGLVTVAPLASLPGLVALRHTDGSAFVDVESGLLLAVPSPSSSAGTGAAAAPRRLFVVFPGEALAVVTRGALKANVHFVDERYMGAPRISMPFFCRPRPAAVIAPPPAHVAAAMEALGLAEPPPQPQPPQQPQQPQQLPPQLLQPSNTAAGSGLLGGWGGAQARSHAPSVPHSFSSYLRNPSPGSAAQAAAAAAAVGCARGDNASAGGPGASGSCNKQGEAAASSSMGWHGHGEPLSQGRFVEEVLFMRRPWGRARKDKPGAFDY